MALKTIITYPHPVLRTPAKPVSVFDAEIEQLMADMAETMYAAPGVGLAANQIGLAIQLVVIDITPKDEGRHLIELVNPRILEWEGDQVDVEGCLSVVDLSAKVKRAQRVLVEARDIHGVSKKIEAEGFLARVIQHELDHLQGRLFIDRLSSLKRNLYKKRLKKELQRQKKEAGQD